MTPPRPRNRGNRDLPPNLYSRSVGGVVYFQYRDPRSGRFHQLGRDKASAVADAKSLNAVILAQIANRKLESILESGREPIRFPAAVVLYWKIIKRERTIKPTTERSRAYILRVAASEFGNLAVDQITIKQVAAFLNRYKEANKSRMAQSIRSNLIDFFRVMIAEGYAKENPALATIPPRVEVKRSRLSLEQFERILATVSEEWLSVAMLLALVTGQRREDISKMKFSDYRDGFLYVEQGKTGARLKLSGELSIAGYSLDGIIKRARNPVLSRFVVHHSERNTLSTPGDAVHVDTISRGFARYRDRLALDWSGAEPATFHEIRSLSGRLHKEAGNDPKLLLGHSEQKTTDLYLAARGEWVSVIPKSKG